MYSIHHSSDVYENPDSFIPERWDDVKKYSSTSWIPFSSGQRICIGNNFSLLEQKLFLVRLIQNFKVSFLNKNDEIEVKKSALLQQPYKKTIKFESI